MDKKLTWRVVSERYITTKFTVVLQESEKNNGYTQNNMVFDHMNTHRIKV
jgi:hypothetical protein